MRREGRRPVAALYAARGHAYRDVGGRRRREQAVEDARSRPDAAPPSASPQARARKVKIRFSPCCQINDWRHFGVIRAWILGRPIHVPQGALTSFGLSLQDRPNDSGRGASLGTGLFDLCFLIEHVFSDDRVKFFDLDFIRHCALVFGRGVIMAGIGRGNELDLLTHDFYPARRGRASRPARGRCRFYRSAAAPAC